MYVANLGSRAQRTLKRGKCPFCLREVYDGTLDKNVGHGDVCPECNIVFVGPLTIAD